jgi:hypothetical protein
MSYLASNTPAVAWLRGLVGHRMLRGGLQRMRLQFPHVRHRLSQPQPAVALQGSTLTSCTHTSRLNHPQKRGTTRQQNKTGKDDVCAAMYMRSLLSGSQIRTEANLWTDQPTSQRRQQPACCAAISFMCQGSMQHRLRSCDLLGHAQLGLCCRQEG